MTSTPEAIGSNSEFSQRLSCFLRRMQSSKNSHSSKNVVIYRKDMHEVEKNTTTINRLQSTLGKFSVLLRTILGKQTRVKSASEIDSPSRATCAENNAGSEESFTDEEIRHIQEEFWRIVKEENNRYIKIPDYTKRRRGVYAVAATPFVPDIWMAGERQERERKERGENN